MSCEKYVGLQGCLRSHIFLGSGDAYLLLNFEFPDQGLWAKLTPLKTRL